MEIINGEHSRQLIIGDLFDDIFIELTELSGELDQELSRTSRKSRFCPTMDIATSSSSSPDDSAFSEDSVSTKSTSSSTSTSHDSALSHQRTLGRYLTSRNPTNFIPNSSIHQMAKSSSSIIDHQLERINREQELFSEQLEHSETSEEEGKGHSSPAAQNDEEKNLHAHFRNINNEFRQLLDCVLSSKSATLKSQVSIESIDSDDDECVDDEDDDEDGVTSKDDLSDDQSDQQPIDFEAKPKEFVDDGQNSSISAAIEPVIPRALNPELVEQNIQLALEKIREASIRKLYVKIHAEDGSSKSLHVDERTSVEVICGRLAMKNHVPLDLGCSIVEHVPHLYLERFYEDHESLVDCVLQWGRDSPNKLYFVSRPDKYPDNLIDDDDEDDQTIAPDIPEMSGHLYLKSDGKKTWKRCYFTLRPSGLYYCKDGRPKSSADLTCLAPFEMNCLYTGSGGDWRRKFRSPTDHGFALKHPQLQAKSDKIKYLCAETLEDARAWCMAIRWAKYGRKLRENYHRRRILMGSGQMPNSPSPPPLPSSPRPSIRPEIRARSCSIQEQCQNSTSNLSPNRKPSLSIGGGKRKASIPRLPLTITTRLLALQSDDAILEEVAEEEDERCDVSPSGTQLELFTTNYATGTLRRSTVASSSLERLEPPVPLGRQNSAPKLLESPLLPPPPPLSLLGADSRSLCSLTNLTRCSISPPPPASIEMSQPPPEPAPRSSRLLQVEQQHPEPIPDLESLKILEPESSNFRVNMTRLLRQKWTVYQQLQADHSLTPTQVLGVANPAYRPPPPPPAQAQERAVQLEQQQQKANNRRSQVMCVGAVRKMPHPPPPPPPSRVLQADSAG